MASTYTTRIGLEKQGDGENANTWGLRLNENVIDLVDEAVAGYETITLSSGETTLTDTEATSNQARNMGLKFTGTLSADCTVVIPATEKVYFAHNSTSGDYDIYIKPSGGTAILMADQGESLMLASNGSTINKLEGKNSVSYASSAGFATSAAVAEIGKTTYAFESSTNANYKVFFGAIDAFVSTATFYYDDEASQFTYNPSTNKLVVGAIQAGIVSATGFAGGTGSFSTVSATGNIVAAGDVTAYSDERLKSKIETLDGTKAFGMRGVSFVKDGKDGSGIIAQELEQIAPELVNSDGEYKSVAYGNVVGYLIEAVKYLKKEIDELKENK